MAPGGAISCVQRFFFLLYRRRAAARRTHFQKTESELMFKKLLVANRGEIAIRIMRSAQELGIKTVAVYEETDKTSMHIMRADEAVCIGSGPRRDYLNIERIIQAAQRTQAEAIHPGYGFLAENPAFPSSAPKQALSSWALRLRS